MQMLEFSMISGIKPYCILEKATSRKLQLTKYKSTGDKIFTILLFINSLGLGYSKAYPGSDAAREAY